MSRLSAFDFIDIFELQSWDNMVTQGVAALADEARRFEYAAKTFHTSNYSFEDALETFFHGSP